MLLGTMFGFSIFVMMITPWFTGRYIIHFHSWAMDDDIVNYMFNEISFGTNAVLIILTFINHFIIIFCLIFKVNKLNGPIKRVQKKFF